MTRSSSGRIFFTGQKVLSKKSYEIKLKWIGGHPEIQDLFFNEDSLPEGVKQEQGSIVTIILDWTDYYYSKDIGNINDISLPDPSEYSSKFSEQVKLKLNIRKGGHGPDSHKLLASTKKAETLRSPASIATGIFGVQAKNIGDLIWRLQIEEETGMPIIIINNKEWNGKSVIGKNFVQDKLFRTLVMPKAIEDILYSFVQAEDYTSEEGELREYSKYWFQWAKKVTKEDPPSVSEVDDLFEREERAREWAISVAEKWSKDNKIFDLFVEEMEGNGQ
jgi:hypothetical protein